MRLATASRAFVISVAVTTCLPLTIGPEGVASAAAPVQTGKVVFTGSPDLDQTDIYTIERDGTGLTQLTTDGQSSQPVWSPDGKLIAYVRGRHVWVMNHDGSNQRQVLSDTAETTWDALVPEWVPDQSAIIFSDGGRVPYRIPWRITGDVTPLDGAFLPPLATYPEEVAFCAEAGLSASPSRGPVSFGVDPALMVYARATWCLGDGLGIATPQVFAAPSATSVRAERRITGDLGYNIPDFFSDLDLSPDGTTVLATKRDSNSNLSMGVYRIDMATGTASEFAEPFASEPAWAPGGEAVAMVSGGIALADPDGDNVRTVLAADGQLEMTSPDVQCTPGNCLTAIIVVKETDAGAAAGSYPATFSYSGSLTGEITDDGNPLAPPGSYFLFRRVPSGPATVTEGLTNGWTLTSISCDHLHTANVGTRGVVVNLEEGDVATCTFTSVPGTSSDADGDGVPDAQDNCVNAANADQADNDLDGIGNACDSTPDGEDPPEDPACELQTTQAGWRAVLLSTDVFQYDATVTWCTDGETVRIAATDTDSSTIMPPIQFTAYELLGVKWKEDPDEAPDPSTTVLGDGSVLITFIGNFDSCYTLPVPGGGPIAKGFSKALDRAWSHLPDTAKRKIVATALKKVLGRTGVDGEKAAIQQLAADLVNFGIGTITDGKCFNTWLPEVRVRVRLNGSATWIGPGEPPGALVAYQWLEP